MTTWWIGIVVVAVAMAAWAGIAGLAVLLSRE